MDVAQFIQDFQDHLAPKLDTYEQAIYLYVFRHTRLLGHEEGIIGFKSARARMACGVGQKGRPMSEGTVYEKLQSLSGKGCIEIIDSTRNGRLMRLRLPSEIPGLVSAEPQMLKIDLESEDFFEDTANRERILIREERRCFYCLRDLNDDNYVIEHVVSRPNGNNSYRNLVAACRQCNNRKGSTSVADWLRTLYREALLSESEFQERKSHLERLLSGELKPPPGAG